MSNIDKRALREAAEKATPGRIGDRIDGSGSIKYECRGYDGSLVLRTDHKNVEYGFIGDNANADELFFRLCVPDVVLALLDELSSMALAHLNLNLLCEVYRLAYEESRHDGLVNWEAAASLAEENGDLKRKLEAAEKRIAELEASHGNLREAMAGIHNTIAGGGAYTSLAAILNASKRAYEESANAAGRINGEG
ncbi:ead/Ea22-like family protein [Enterobacter hormaechei]|uniref:ead/Ea22-like family protein n=1 Tax=Enterobacter hormaechei TaxID=158836 RepID=UPI00115D6ECA|nr:ead/Ea22-like family protein [Enterobacter hormaechei]